RVLDPALRPTDALSQVAGITFRDGGRITSTAERSRHESLEDFPSPYLTGEFDHVDSSGWQWPSIGTNRGCPYSCSFCDWGSATRSRVRDFPMERVLGELQWLSDHGLPHWMINDANFGIHRRDVEIAKFIVELRRAGGVPEALYMSYAKNTVKYLAEIIKMITEAGIIGEAALALQTRDPETLRAIKRSNIRVEKFDDLAEEFRRYGLPLVTDLIIGLPGQTVESFLTDMQYCVDNDVTPRFFVALNLPNAEFNNPEYQRKFSIVLGDGDVVVETSSFTRSDRDRMMRLRMAYRSFEHFALLRHVFRYLQWDHGIAEATVIERIEAVTAASPERYPLLSWVQGYFDMFLIPPFGWPPFFAEVATFVSEEFGIEDDAVLRTVFEVQMAILPEPNRTFPSTVHLDHDYVTWFEAHGRQRPDGPRLGELPPGELVVTGDPCQCCVTGVGRQCDVRPHELIIAPFWAALHWELDSPVQRIVPAVAVSNSASQQQDPAAGPGGPAADPEGVGATASVDATV
ncbi:MAG TPA: radical SAM protein, partial [Acidimicrobiales bacterium]|nr:radical SAM protein [Acidimicrobiales bacterium]